jgi:hypothetical protein
MRGEAGTARQEAGNGIWVVILPVPLKKGRARESGSERAGGRLGRECEAAGRERPQDGGLETAGRFGRVKGRREQRVPVREERAGELGGDEPGTARRKAGMGSGRANHPAILAATLRTR